jgi:CubicO group peptidase (beta-lactamase class C family)
VLSVAADAPYGEVIEQRIFGPLGMTSTGIRSSSDDVRRLATAHLATGEAAPWWDVGAMLGAGGIRSTVADLLRLARANIDPSSTPIGDALELAQQPRIAESERMRFGLGWVLLERADTSTIIWHNGGTYGFHSFIALHRPSATAVVALANNGGVNHDAAALQLLSAAIAAATR